MVAFARDALMVVGAGHGLGERCRPQTVLVDRRLKADLGKVKIQSQEAAAETVEIGHGLAPRDGPSSALGVGLHPKAG